MSASTPNITIITGTINTGPAEQASGGDITIQIRQDQIDSSLLQDESDLVVTRIDGAPFYETAPEGHYTCLVAGGVVFEIISIKEHNGFLHVKIRPTER